MSGGFGAPLGAYGLLADGAPGGMGADPGAAESHGTPVPVPDIRTATQLRAVLDASPRGVALCVHAEEWCAPCRVLRPRFDAWAQVARDHRSGVAFVRVSLTDGEPVADALGVTSLPTVVAFREGVEVARMQGADPARLRELMTVALGLPPSP